MAKSHKKKIILTLCSLLLVLFVFPYLINICTNYRLHYLWIEYVDSFPLLITQYKFAGYTPDNFYAIHIVRDAWLDETIEIEVTKRFSYRPFQAMQITHDYSDEPFGPIKGRKFDIICSKDSRYIAMILNGWFVDLYDFNSHTRDSRTNEINQDKWIEYHNRIYELIDMDFVSILNPPSDTKTN